MDKSNNKKATTPKQTIQFQRLYKAEHNLQKRKKGRIQTTRAIGGIKKISVPMPILPEKMTTLLKRGRFGNGTKQPEYG
ncbi:hypothetical protein T10_7016 [Trichinella papuae]|uniref:Uncharacterized protein n=1 Tax=Trichinella papuae TaxID=268474 RepID=A0A0V1N264_9BILA|nr:hypothetical protein T10_7016 [Trichinella papuae]